MNDPKLEVAATDAWEQIKFLDHAIREERTNPIYQNYVPVRTTCLKKGKQFSGNTDTQSMCRRRASLMNKVARAGTEFLQQNGFTSGGQARKINPHKPKPAPVDELALVQAQIAELEALLKGQA